MNRWTIKELNETDDITFAISILNERRQSTSNRYSPLNQKINETVSSLEKVKEKEVRRREAALRLSKLLSDSDKLEDFAVQVAESIYTDDESPKKVGSAIVKALLKDDAEALLVAICGWNSESILGFMENTEEDC